MTYRRRRRPMDMFDSRGRHGPGYRVRRARAIRRFFAVLAIPALVALLVLGFNTFKGVFEPDAHHLTVLGHEGQPISGAILTADNGRQATSLEGGNAFLVFDPPMRIGVEAEGYEPAIYQVDALPPNTPLALQMEPLVLQGRITDRFGNGVVGAAVEVGSKSTHTLEFGNFEIVGAAPGEVSITKNAWEDLDFVWDGSDGRIDIEMKPFIVRGIRVYAYKAADDAVFDDLLRIADQTAVNTLVFDTKAEGGEVVHDVQNQEAHDAGAVKPQYDVEARLAQAKAHGLYTITRIVTFQDYYMAQHKPEAAIAHSETGEPWTNWKGLGWMDATDPDSWEYPIALGLEACALGFDEIQYDYVRFPTDGDLSTTVYDNPEVTSQQVRVEAIAGFLAEARHQINEAGCAVSADIFSIVLSVNDDQGLGQKVEELSWSVDALSPMLYPSHYGRGWLGFDNPNDYPAEVVGEALTKGVNRSQGGALIRPWLQAFSWTNEQVQESIMTTEELASGWLLWNAVSEYELEWIPDLEE